MTGAFQAPPDEDSSELALADLRDGLPVFVGLLALFVADALLDGSASAIAAIAIIAATIATLLYRNRTSPGRDRRAERRRLEASLDDGERRAFGVVRFAPVGLGVVAGALANDGVRIEVFAITTLVAFVAAQLLFVLWLSRRRPAEHS